MKVWSRWSRNAAVATLALVLGACGTYTSRVDPIFEGVVGPGGGTVAAGPVLLVIAPGALVADTVVKILPQPTPLPIDPADGDIDYMPGLYCIGPVGQLLAGPCHVRICYDAFDIPVGSTLEDLVLLEWDDVAQLMHVRGTAVHDTVGHCFDDVIYGELGHIGVGVRVGPPPPKLDFVFAGVPDFGGVVAPAGGRFEIVTNQPSLVLADSTGTLDPVEVDGTQRPSSYIGSRDGSRILFELPDQSNEFRDAYTVDVAPAGPFTPRLVLGAFTYTSGTPQLGWHGSEDRVHFEESLLVSMQIGPLPTTAFSTVPGVGGSHTQVRARGGDTFLDDVRYSRDRSKVLLRWVEFSKGVFYHVDTVDVATGALIAEDLPTSTDDGDVTPRWLPDGSGIYFVEDDGVTVTRCDPDGTNASTLYTLPATNSVLLDFVVSTQFGVAPVRGCYVRRDLGNPFQGAANGGSGQPNCFYETDRLTGGDVKSLDLIGDYDVVELVAAYSDAWNTSLVVAELSDPAQTQGVGSPLPLPVSGKTLVFGEDDPGLWTSFPVPLSAVDLRNVDGRSLVTIDFPDANYPQFPIPGIYATDIFFGNPTLVTPPGYAHTQPARWLRSWRFSSGLFTSLVR